jgi:hypothetical protein
VEDEQEATPGEEPVQQPAELLDEMALLRRRTRAARHAYWFPLVLFGVLICASAPLYIPPNQTSGTVTRPEPWMPLLGGFPGFFVSGYLGYYWLTGLFAGLLLTLLWYRRRARQVGLATPALGYIITIAVLTVLAFSLPLLAHVGGLHWLQRLWDSNLVVGGKIPFLIIAVGLWALAWAERSWVLAVTSAAYTGAALLASLYNVENILFRLGWKPASGEELLTTLPGVLLPALVLLIAGACAFAVQRPHRVAS